MTFLPVIERELRAESRRPFNYWLRVIGAGALIVAAALVLLPTISGTSFGMRGGVMVNPATGLFISGQNPFGAVGKQLFGYMNATIFVAMWLLVPLLTADAISREKREGTLGLLFLTPLTSRGIVVGKGVVHALRALTLYFTMLPVLLMPLMIGGVTTNDAIMAAMLNLGALLLALAAGLLASAWTRDWLKSVAVAIGLSLLFSVLFMVAHGAILESATSATPGTTPWQNSLFRSHSHHSAGALSALRDLFAVNTGMASGGERMILLGARPTWVNSPSLWSDVWSSYPPAVHRAWMTQTGCLLLGCGGLFWIALVVAGRSVERGWRQLPPSPQRQRVNEVLSRPVVRLDYLRRRMSRALDRNPIGWLQQYSWQARMTKWGWCIAIVVFEIIFGSSWRDAWDAQYWLAALVLLGVSFSAAGSFHRERETGAFELLLVTPLRPHQIIRGRVAGVRMQFLPSFAILVLAWISLAQPSHLNVLLIPERWPAEFLGFAWLFAVVLVSFLTLPIIGLYFSMRPINQMVSWVCTCVVGLLVLWVIFSYPGLVLGLLRQTGILSDFAIHLVNGRWTGLAAAFLWQLLAAMLAGGFLLRNLTRREFLVAHRG